MVRPRVVLLSFINYNRVCHFGNAMQKKSIDESVLTDDVYAAEYLTQAYHKGSHSEFAEAIGRVCRARNCMSEVAAKTGLARPALYNALGPTGNPRLSTLYAVLKALNLEVVLKPSQPVSNHDH